MPRRTALIIAVPEAESLVSELRRAHDPAAARGVPAHVTLLFPFAPHDAIEEEALAELFGRFPAFAFALDRVERFDEGTVWLHPAPSTPFVDLTAAVRQRWPQYPPYEGIHDEVIPHLTVSEEPVEVDLPLPIACTAREVTLFEEDAQTGHWMVRRRFPLGQGVE